MSHQTFVVDTLPPPGGAYSHVTALNGIQAQTEATLANVARALGVVGLDLSNLLKVTVHVVAATPRR